PVQLHVGECTPERLEVAAHGLGAPLRPLGQRVVPHHVARAERHNLIWIAAVPGCPPVLCELPCIVGGHRLVSLGRWSARRRSRISSRARWARASKRSSTPPRPSSPTSRLSTGGRWRSPCSCTSATCAAAAGAGSTPCA